MRIALFMLLVVGVVFAQAAPMPAAFKQEGPALGAAVHEAVVSVAPGQKITQAAKAAYIEGFGVVVTIETALEPAPNAFSPRKAPADVTKIVTERRQMIRQKLEAFLKDRMATLTSVGTGESLAVVVHLFNAYPVDLPNLPSQLVFTVKKLTPTQVSVTEF